MSVALVIQIMERIKVAANESPIAVFRNSFKGPQTFDKLDAVFANTVFSKQRIANDSGNLIGIYTKDSDIAAVHVALNKATLKGS
jgi:hypothetical protein